MRFVLVLIAVLAAGRPATAGDDLVIGITQFPSTLHPNIDSMLAKTYVLGMTRRPFTIYGPDWQLTCMLCETLPTLDNGLAVKETTPDGKPGIAVTYTIRDDAVWGDGTPVTTDDVVFTWKVGRHPKTGVGNMEFYRSLYAVDVEDERTFTLHFDKLTFEYNAINDFSLLPAHLERAAFEKDPAAYRNRTTFDSDPTNPGLAYGPYHVVELQPGAHIVLEPNPTWWGEAPHFERIVVRVIENTAALEANLLSGAIDMIAGELGLTVDQALAFERRHGDTFKVLYKPGLVYEHLDVNLDNPVLADKRVRKALIHGIDRKGISEQLFDGRQPVAHSNVNPLDWVYADDIPHYSFDPDRARALLAEAGWTPGPDGIRRNAAGEPLRLVLMSTAGNRSRELVEQVLQSQWKDIGIDTRIRNEPARVFFGETVSKRKFPGLAMFAWISAPESVPRTSLHSDHIPKPDNNWSGQNYTGFENAGMDRVIEAIETELDRDRRKRLWHRLQDIYARELPVIPLYFRANAYILPKGLTGLTPTGHQYPSTYWVEDWRLEN